jgi:hypothetical protein
MGAVPAAEHQLVAALALTRPRQVVQQERRQRHAAGLVPLGGAHVDRGADLNGVLRHHHPPPQQVQVAHPQAGGLSPAQAGVGQQQHQRLVGTRCAGQHAHLLMGQVRLGLAGQTRQLDPGCRVGGDHPVFHGVGQDRREHLMGARDRRRPRGFRIVVAATQVGYPLLHRTWPDIAERHVPPARRHP